MSINQQQSDIYWLNKDSRKFLQRGYLLEDETPEQRIRDIAVAAEKILKEAGFAAKFEDYMHRGFYSLASPIWSNFGRSRGLPISCFGSQIPDTMAGILNKVAEVGIMTKNGGGTSAYFGDLRPRGSEISSGGESTGSIHFMELYNKLMSVVSQGNVRRGSFAAYLPVDHGDIEEFLKIRGEGNEIQDISIGVTVSDAWMKSMIDGDKEKRKIWGLVLKKRFESGYPYIFFTDNVNKQAPKVYKDKKLKIKQSNLCTEIMLPNSEDESFVCDLSSMNLERWEEWKDTDAVETMIWFLDAVMTEFINKTENMRFMEAPRKFAMRHRALGLGVLGWHSLLQSKMIAFESMEAKLLNTTIWKSIRERSDKASEQLAKIYGEPELLEGYGRRNTTTLAIAPTTSSSFILGQVSPSIEPNNSNYYVKDLAKGKFSYKNPYLKKLLKEKNKNEDEVWMDILTHSGSVQHLDFLTQEEKDVFKTFEETSQKEIIIQAASRQKYIDQGQSLNMLIPSGTPPKAVNELVIFAWEQGIKSLYYQRSTNPAKELARSIMTCKSCES
jgi:ribonucleoside-diphosphate reductase alpha chain